MKPTAMPVFLPLLIGLSGCWFFGGDGGLPPCHTDTECGCFQSCDQTTKTCVGTPPAGGETNPRCFVTCDGDDAALGAGDGAMTIVEAGLFDAAATVPMFTCPAGTSPFTLTWELGGQAGFNGSNDEDVRHFLRFRTHATTDPDVYAAQTCLGGPVSCIDDGPNASCSCGLCLTTPPNDLAIQIITHAGTTAGVCVALDGARFQPVPPGQ